MKVVLSRKGFDSSNGGMPSLIMPNGDMVSMPIPSDDTMRYDKLRYGEKSYLQILKELRSQFYLKTCHADPDLASNRYLKIPEGWRPSFGQRGAAASHLMKTVRLAPGDLFLFFGNFRWVETVNGRYRFMKNTGCFRKDREIQAIWGWLQVGHVLDDPKVIAKEYPWHPHSARFRREDPTNILIVPTDKLTFLPDLPGSGVFPYSRDRVLTQDGASKGTWRFNEVYDEGALISRRRNAAKGEGIFYSGIWQELALKESEACSQWAKGVFINEKADENEYSRIAPGCSGDVYSAVVDFEDGSIDRPELIGRLQCIDGDAQDALEEDEISDDEYQSVMKDIALCMDWFDIVYEEAHIVTGYEGKV